MKLFDGGLVIVIIFIAAVVLASVGKAVIEHPGKARKSAKKQQENIDKNYYQAIHLEQCQSNQK